MAVRIRGFVILLVSAIGTVAGLGLQVHFVRVPTFAPLVMAVPLVGVMIGLIEMVSGVPIGKAGEGWRKLPWFVKIPVGLIGGFVFYSVFILTVMWGLSGRVEP